MKKLLTDMHTHSTFSHDGQNELKDMLAAAQKKGIAFYGTSEHFDYDYDEKKMSAEIYSQTRDANPEDYFHAARHLQDDYAGVMNVIVGAEFGYTNDPVALDRYVREYEKFRPDFVINSVHSIGGVDYCRIPFTKDKAQTYREYLAIIRESLDAPYPYDIVGHIGYVARYVPFEDGRLSLDEFGAELDDIFKTIIQKDKILDVNSASKHLPQLSLPSVELIARYFALGGRKISFGSDAHFLSRIADKREEVVAALKEIGFTYITVPCKGEHIKVEI